MEPLLRHGIGLARQVGAEYAELTAVEIDEKALFMQNSHVYSQGNREAGYSVRLLASGRWGFAAGPATSRAAVGDLVKAASAGAMIAPDPEFPVRLGPAETTDGKWESSCALDPFTVPDSDLVEALEELDEAMGKGVDWRCGRLHFRRERRRYLNSEGSSNSQVFTLTGAGAAVTACSRGEIQRRSWPSWGGYSGAGYEYISRLALPEQGRRLAREAAALAKAAPCPQGVLDVVLMGPFLGGLLLSTLGPYFRPAATDCRRPLLRKQVASPQLSLFSDAALPEGAGSYGFDSEGTRAQLLPLVEQGSIADYLLDRETAAAMGRLSSGNARADSWLEPPSPQLANLVVKPGNLSLSQLIGGVERGLLLDVSRFSPLISRSGSFTAGGEAAWLIENGALTGMVKNPFIRGKTATFWNGCDAAGSPEERSTWGFRGKGAAIGCCVVPLRIRGVKVGGIR